MKWPSILQEILRMKVKPLSNITNGNELKLTWIGYFNLVILTDFRKGTQLAQWGQIIYWFPIPVYHKVEHTETFLN